MPDREIVNTTQAEYKVLDIEQYCMKLSDFDDWTI